MRSQAVEHKRLSEARVGAAFMSGDGGRRQTVLVIDDEPHVCDSVRDLLRREFHVLTATNAQDGFRLLREHPVHVLLTDQRMPRVTGVEVLEQAHANHPRAVRLLFTGFSDLESIVAAINHGHVFEFIKKPWNPEALLDAVRRAGAECARLMAEAEETARLRDEVHNLKQRVSRLEEEVRRLESRSTHG